MRFRECTNNLERFRCSEFLTFYSTNSLSWDQLSYIEKNDILNLHYGLIHNGAPTLINSNKYKLPFIADSIKNYTLVENGDIVFADASEDTKDIGKAVEFLNINNDNIVCGLHTIHARDTLNITIPGFKGYLFNSYVIHKQVRRLAQGTKIYSINSSNFKEMFVHIPCKEEQTKIYKFLSRIDDRIETQSKIIEKLQSQMLAIYHQVFSQLKSEVLPLAKLCSLQKGTQVNGISLLENGPYYFMNGGIVPSGFYNEWNTETNTISISEGGNSCGYVQYNKERFWSGGHCYTLQNLNKVSVRYLYHFLKSHEKDIMRLRIGTGLPNIQKKDLEQFLIKVPSLLEQERLVQLLDSFELKIETEGNLFKKYKEQKKFLLSNMFI